MLGYLVVVVVVMELFLLFLFFWYFKFILKSFIVFEFLMVEDDGMEWVFDVVVMVVFVKWYVCFFNLLEEINKENMNIIEYKLCLFYGIGWYFICVVLCVCIDLLNNNLEIISCIKL